MSLNHFSPSGCCCSAVRNRFLNELQQRSEHRVTYTIEPVGEHVAEFRVGPRGRTVYLPAQDKVSAEGWVVEGFTEALRTPDATPISVPPQKALGCRAHQNGCMRCLTH